MVRGSRFFLPMMMVAAALTAGACGGKGATDTSKTQDAAESKSGDRQDGKESLPVDPAGNEQPGPKKVFALKSPGFSHHGTIPARYTCDGEGVSPELYWEEVPEGVKSFILVVDDPDAQPKSFLHWIVYNLPPDARSLKEGIPAGAAIPDLAGAVQTTNGAGKVGWEALCPPAGRPHRYVFRIYALDTTLDLPGAPTRAQVEEAWKGHFLGQAGIIASYARAAKG